MKFDTTKLYSLEAPIAVPYMGFSQAFLRELELTINRGGFIGFVGKYRTGNLAALMIAKSKLGRYFVRSVRGWKDYNFETGAANPNTSNFKKKRTSSKKAKEKTLEERLLEELEAFKAQQVRDLADFHRGQAVKLADFIRRQAEVRAAASNQKRREQEEREQREAAYRAYEEAKRRRAEEAAREEARRSNQSWYDNFKNNYNQYNNTRPQSPPPPAAKAWWSVLGVNPNDSLEVVKKAWKSAQFNTHPDRGGSHEAFIEVSNAWRTAQRHFSN